MHDIDVKTVARAGLGRLVDLLFPANCVGCGREGNLLCERCAAEATRLDGPVCRRCARRTRGPSLCDVCAASPLPLASLIAVYQFDGVIRDAIHALKYQDLRVIAPVLAQLITDDPRVGRLEIDAVVPTPLHRARERRRGYNQAGLLASEIARYIAAPMDAGLLARVVDNAPQVEVASEAERKANVAGIFEARGNVRGLRLLLVDDVATTGSTLNECARALLAAGAARVHAVVLAKEL